MSVKLLTKEEILKVAIANPEKIFSGDLINLKKTYRILSIAWHPDKNKNPDSQIVFAHISSLYHSAVEKFNKGLLGSNKNIIDIIDKKGNESTLKFYKERKTEMGNMYISNKFVTWKFKNEFMNDIKKGLSNLSKLSFRNDKMKTDFKKYIPELYRNIESENYSYLIFSKESRFINLSDILDYYNGKIDAKHVAWILSVIYNQICFFHFNKIMHGGLTIENIYIDPKMHDGIILGGWWFSLKDKEKLSILPKKAVDVAPVSMLNSKKADLLLDLEMIKSIGIQLLGYKNGIQLVDDKTVPEPLTEWLRTASLGEAIKDYSFWFNEVLPQSFGKRKFVEMNININDIYIGE
jgi:hypothetical protein